MGSDIEREHLRHSCRNGYIIHARDFCGVVSLLFIFLVSFFPLKLKAESALSKSELSRIGEAMKSIRDDFLMPTKSAKEITDDMLRFYIRSIDDYGDYLTGREYRAFLESNNSDYFGVEMDIERKKGRIYLYPFKGGLAENLGLRTGDELIAVNGAPVYGQSVFLVGSKIRGAKDVTVQLTIRRGEGIPRIFSLRRKRTNYLSVRYLSFADADFIQITRFVENSDRQLKTILSGITDQAKTLVIDLRGNQGGNLQAARQCADYFLPFGAILFHLQTRRNSRDITATLPEISRNPVIVIQDRITASAAEVFIAALVENGRALSVGEKSYGKGLAQRFIPLVDGSALRLTFAEILTPEKHRYQGKGLLPDVPMALVSAGSERNPEQIIRDVLNMAGNKQQ